jgi:NDP-sugar pyrophosphorylase family protein
MKAMVLAAGLGTRLRPLTDERPKALVKVGSRTLLEIVLARLRSFGVREVIVNVHHFAAMVEEYLVANGNFGMRIELSREQELLDTGGGLKKAAWFLGGDDPFLLHNADVVSTIDLGRMAEVHKEQGALATLAVEQRESSRALLFDAEGRLCGRRLGRGMEPQWARETTGAQELAFAGIHVISPKIFKRMSEEGAFSIIDAYLRLAAEGEKIAAFRVDGCAWRDVGRPESLKAAEQELERGRFSRA